MREPAVVGGMVAVAMSVVLATGSLSAEVAARNADRPTALRSLRVSPSSIRIGGANRQQLLLVTAESTDEMLFDVTHACDLSISDASVASVRDSLIQGVADGSTTLNIHYGSRQLSVPITVAEYDNYPPVHFENDVIPVLSKLGCNSGNCHGKQSGKNGFRLSVFGFDPAADYNALTKEARGRRVFPFDAHRSLLVTKATGRSAHGGGRRTEVESSDAVLLTEWIRQGMPWGDQGAAQLQSVRVEPVSRVMPMQANQQILVTAIFSDGSQRDVTRATAFTSNSEVVAEVDESGRLSTGQVPGEAAITVNYMGQVAAVRVLVPRGALAKPYPDLPVNNPIDRLVWDKLRKMRIVPSDLADDATFLRRLYIDATGKLPTPDEVRAFLADNIPGNRNRAIDVVLGRDAFADYWAMKWADILLVDQAVLGQRGAYEFHRWLRNQFHQNRAYNEWVRELLTATGNSAKFGPVNFYRALRKPEELTRAVSQAFLGVRMDCAQCHHHPFEKWGQHDFYGMAGFFQGLKRKNLRPGRELVYHGGYQPTKLPLSGEVVPTRPPDGVVPEDLKNGDPRVHLARWATDPANPWFARLAANRVWKNYLGRGLVEPVDDFRSTNPPTNAPLLDFLAQYLVKTNFDLKALMRLILQSRVYQLSSIPNHTNKDDEQNFSHHFERRLSAAVLLDAVCDVTGVPEEFPGMMTGTRAVQLWDNRLPSYFLDTFGRSERRSPCECGTSSEPTMAQSLHLMNAPEIEAKIISDRGRVARLLAANLDQQRLVNELCLAALGRNANEKEKRVASELYGQHARLRLDDSNNELQHAPIKNASKSRDTSPAATRLAAQDFLWALLNSYDFLFVH